MSGCNLECRQVDSEVFSMQLTIGKNSVPPKNLTLEEVNDGGAMPVQPLKCSRTIYDRV